MPARRARAWKCDDPVAGAVAESRSDFIEVGALKPPSVFDGLYLGRPWWNLAMCALRLWNFFAVAVLHAPIESPWR
jgi:hypothetical protein